MERRSASSIPPPASTTAPQVRARHPQTLLRLARTAAPAVYPSVVAALGAETRATLDEALPMAWLPIAVDVAVVEAIAGRLGPASTASLLEARQRDEMGSALFASFIQMTLGVFGASPMMIVKRLPAGWQQVLRNAGVVEILGEGRGTARVRFSGLPLSCVTSVAWMAALPVGLHMLYELVGAKGTVECQIEDAAQGTALVTFRWQSG